MTHFDSGPNEPKTDEREISGHHNYCEFYYPNIFPNFKMNGNAVVDGKLYVADVTSLENQVSILFPKLTKHVF